MKRYKFYLFTITILLLLFACDTTNSGEHEPATSPMNFNGIIASDAGDWLNTRATVAFPTGDKFGVYAYNTGSSFWNAVRATAIPDVMCNQMMEKTTTGVTYTPVKYWILTQYYSFFAYAPYNAAGITLLSGSSTPDIPLLEYEMPSNTASQVDILYTSVLDQREADGTSVALHFKHALARIRFTAEVEEGASQYTAKITGLIFSGLMNRGTLSLQSGAWNSMSGSIVCTMLDQNNASDDIDIPYSATTPKVALSAPIYILPQTIADEGEIVLHYEITSPFEDDPIKRTATFSQKGVVFSGAQSVNYHFTFGLTEVRFTLQVENWTEQDDPKNGITSME